MMQEFFNYRLRKPLIFCCLLIVAGCGGGSSGTSSPVDDGFLDPTTDSATYRVLVSNYWSVEDYPQGFPVDAHLSLWGGATHNAAVSFWEPGQTLSAGMEDMAETGRIDLLLAEDVGPAIRLGTADSALEKREYTGASVAGIPGSLEFDIVVNRSHPRVTLVSMLGPSPDWFVGTNGETLLQEELWLASKSVDLPLWDGGSKAGDIPVMGGPDIIPRNPVSLLGYDDTSGTYIPVDEEQVLANIVFTRVR